MGETVESLPPYPFNLVPPRSTGKLFHRPRLRKALASQESCRLVVITAPAGFGKTSLALSHAAQHQGPVCWFTLDGRYQDGARFLAHLALSIQRVFPHLDLAALPPLPDGAAFRPEHAAFVDALAARLSTLSGDRCLVILDGFHHVQDSDAVVRAFDLLLQQLPATYQILLLSRTQPTLPSLPLLLAYGQASRLSAQSLAFTQEETADWVRDSGLDLDEGGCRHLWTRYEGWIAGMALAAHRASFDGLDPGEVAGAGEQDWYDFIDTQVYQRLPAALQAFLSRTAILEELEATACDGLLGTSDALKHLKALAGTWQLLQRVPGTDEFRCLAGLRRFLVHRLRELDELELAATHRQAAAFFLEQEDWEAAVYHFCEARRPEEAAVALQQAAAGLYTAGEWARLARLIDLLPESTLDRSPALLIYRARCAAQTGDGEAAFHLSGRALDLLHEGPNAMLAQAHVARAAAFRLSGLLERCIQECDQSIGLLRDASDRAARLTLAESYHYQGTAYNQSGRLEEAAAALQQALALYQEEGDLYHLAYAHHHLGSVYRGLGDFGRSASHYREAESGWHKVGNRVALASTMNNLGNLLLSQGQLLAAEEALTDAVRHAEEGQSQRVLSHALDSLGDLLRHTGQDRRALVAYRQGTAAARECSEHKTLVQSAEGLALTYLAMGDFLTAGLTVEEAVGQTGTQTGAEILGRLLTSQSVIQRSLGLYKEARYSILRARQILSGSGTNETRARCLFHYAALLWAEHDPGVAPLVEEIGTLLPQPGMEAVLLADARLSLLFVQRYAGQKKGASVFQRLLRLLTEFPGEPIPGLALAPGQAKPAVRAYGFGHGVVELTDPQPRPVRWVSEKAKELFFYLLIRNSPAQKEEILDALWPDAEPAKADTLFWTTASRMRSSVRHDCLVREGSSYRLSPALSIWFDVQEFEDLVHQALRGTAVATERASKLQRALNLYKGDLLRECYGEWPESLRSHLEERHLAAMVALARIWMDKGAMDPVVELCDQVLETNPYHPEATCLKIEALARSGRLPEAEAAFQAHVRLLDNDLQEEPDARVRETYSRFVPRNLAPFPPSGQATATGLRKPAAQEREGDVQ